MEGVLVIFIFMGVIAVTALVFGVWIVVSVIRLLGRGFGALFAPPGLPPMPSAARGIVCAHENCRAVNPGLARFCRRCGRALPSPQRVGVRRAAVW